MAKHFEDFPREQKVRWYAKAWWEFDHLPPQEYRAEAIKYIHDNPQEFKGAVPQERE